MDVFIEFLGGSKGGKNLPGKPLNLYSVGVDSKTPGALNSLSAKLEDLKGSPSSSLWFIELVKVAVEATHDHYHEEFIAENRWFVTEEDVKQMYQGYRKVVKPYMDKGVFKG